MKKDISVSITKPVEAFVLNSHNMMVDDLYTAVWNKAIESGAEYVLKNLSRGLLFKKRRHLWMHALENLTIMGLVCEFGVHSGASINFFANTLAPMAGLTIYGFDSFEGIKEPWYGTQAGKNAMNMNGELPKVRDNIVLIKGWFVETIPVFLQNHSDNMAFIHIDSDTYNSANTILQLCHKRIVPGTIICFDDYLAYPNWQNGEFKAWQEFVAQYKVKYEYLGFASNSNCAIKILSVL